MDLMKTQFIGIKLQKRPVSHLEIKHTIIIKSGVMIIFILSHRDEQRGIGGLFFDDLNEGGFEKCFEFLQSVGNHFIKAYLTNCPEKRMNFPYTAKAERVSAL